MSTKKLQVGARVRIKPGTHKKSPWYVNRDGQEGTVQKRISLSDVGLPPVWDVKFSDGKSFVFYAKEMVVL